MSERSQQRGNLKDDGYIYRERDDIWAKESPVTVLYAMVLPTELIAIPSGYFEQQ
ncbi:MULTISPECIES: hypothetical protein [Photorhabdus]|uniref:hypothetical protein n=1 Tax=Photorhabdus TaxID=29487 RepID=UPI001314F83E|nr:MULTISPECIES: hypothetical protein [Photorhabdus]MCT8341411.1 hypothetical protein [Photorhabdus kleinii]